MKLKNILIILAIFQIVNHAAVFAGFIEHNSEESKEDVKYSCTCIDKSKNEYILDKISIETKGTIQTNNLTVKNGLSLIDLFFNNLYYINFNENEKEINEEGYVKAKVKLYDQETEKEYLICVGTTDDPVYLKGIDEDSNKISIKLKDCKKVLFKDFSKDYQEKARPSHGVHH